MQHILRRNSSSLGNTPPPSEDRWVQIVPEFQEGDRRVQVAPECQFPNIAELSSDTMREYVKPLRLLSLRALEEKREVSSYIEGKWSKSSRCGTLRCRLFLRGLKSDFTSKK